MSKLSGGERKELWSDDMRRNVTIGLIVVVLLMILIGCSRNDTNNQIFENTKMIESLDYKFSNYEITYEVYENAIADLIGKIDMEENLSRNFPLSNEYVKTLTEEELKKMIETKGTYSVEVEISNVYDYLDIKYIYTKAAIVPDVKNEVGVDLTETRRYVYVLEADKWILANIERGMYEKDIKINDMDLVRFDNELVEYVEIFDPLEILASKW